MKVLVCLCQVCDGEAAFSIAPDGLSVVPSERVAWRMNRYDEFALEEALRLKDSGIAQRVDALSVGPLRTLSTLRKALETGADDAALIRLDRPAFPAEKAGLIASHAAGREYDLILAGVMSEQGLSGATGPMIAACLGIPFATAALRLEAGPLARLVRVEREIDSATREAFTLTLPALVTVQSGINRPRYPSLSNVMRAKTQEIGIIDPAPPAAFQETPASAVYRMPDRGHAGLIIRGTAGEAAEELYRWLHGRSLL